MLNSFRPRIAGLFLAMGFLAGWSLPVRAALFMVETQSRDYVPADTTINVGDTVRWTGLQSSPGHDVVQVSQSCFNNVNCVTPLIGGFISGDQGDVATYDFTFNAAGTYYYICRPHHDDSMQGRIIVISGPTPTPTPSVTPTPSPTPSPTPIPPVNDDCANAICLSDTVAFNGTTTGATGTDITTGCGTNDGADVWFTYTPVVSGMHAVDTCALNGFDTVIALYDACGGSELACFNNNFCSTQDVLVYPMVAGTTYSIRLSGNNGATGNYAITVTGGGGGCGNQAGILSNTIPAQLAASHPASVSVTVQNQGSTTWTSAGGYFLSVTADSCTMGPGGQTVAIPAGVTILPAAQFAFTLSLNPPASPANCNMSFRMSQTGPGAFGDTLSVTPEVVAVSNNAQFVSDGIPDDIFVSQNAWVSLTMKNLCNAQWLPTGSYTIAVNSDGCGILSASNYSPVEVVNPNTNTGLFVYLIAPSSPTTCAFQLQMKDGGTPFGPTMDFSVNYITKPNAAADWTQYD